MGLGFKIKVRRFTPFTDFRVFRIILANGNTGIRHIGDCQHDVTQSLFHFLEFLVRFSNLISKGTHGKDLLRSVFTIFLHLADFSTDAIAHALIRFHFLEQVTALLVKLPERIKIHFCVTVLHGLGHFI